MLGLQEELEVLNSTSEEINKLEIELDVSSVIYIAIAVPVYNMIQPYQVFFFCMFQEFPSCFMSILLVGTMLNQRVYN